MCKCSNIFSRSALICRVACRAYFRFENTKEILSILLYVSLAETMLISSSETKHFLPGGHSEDVTPVSIPNTEVKSPSGEGTAGVARGRVARCQAL